MPSMPCLIAGVLSLAISASATGTPGAGCSPGPRHATYTEIEPWPIGDQGLATINFNPYMDVNYTGYSVSSTAEAGNPGNFILYRGRESSVLDLLNWLLNLLRIPPLLPQPRIDGATADTSIQMHSMDFKCVLRNNVRSIVGHAPLPESAANLTKSLPVPCTVTICSTEVSSQCFDCAYSGGGNYETCYINLPTSKGFTMKTSGKLALADRPKLNAKLESIQAQAEALNLLVQFNVATLFDNLEYSISCGR